MPVFNLPPKDRVIHMLRADLEAAKIPYKIDPLHGKVVDFHSFRETNLLSWASGARYRMGMKRSDRAYLPFCFNLPPALEDKDIHVAEMFERVVAKLPGTVATTLAGPPLLKIPSDISSRFVGFFGKATVKVVLYVGASVIDRRWPSAGFAALADHAVPRWERATDCHLRPIARTRASAEDYLRSVGGDRS